jgi:DNA polymerase I - 3''-5'' exonuclease and polymerase domains
MLKLAPNRYLIEPEDHLPEIAGSYIVADAETTSFSHVEEAFYPRKGHRVCGWAVCGSEGPAYYIPTRSTHPLARNLDPEKVNAWLREQILKKGHWVNHNIKFDAHFLDVESGKLPKIRLSCTNALAKMVNSDRWSHELKPLCKDWLKLPMEEEDEIKAYLKGFAWHDGFKKRRGTKDYATLPTDMIGRYATMDVIGARMLYEFCLDGRVFGPWETEEKLTWRLFEVERTGIRVDLEKTQIQLLTSSVELLQLTEYIQGVTGREFKDSNACLYDIFIDMLGLPVLGYTDKQQPSFNKDAMLIYENLPEVTKDPKTKKLVHAVIRSRKLEKYKSLFLDTILSKHVKGIVHCSYNQIVRTGRMSCRDPNLQQGSKDSTELFIPREGKRFLCFDASQLEFRLIVHHCKIASAIRQYNLDAKTDFHQFVATMCGIERSPGKTINFATAYGAGKRKIQQTLIGVLAESMEGTPEEVRFRCSTLAEEVYRTYHKKFPEIKQLSESCESVTKERGYIKNAYGRRRHLPAYAAYKAFNTAVQGGAMDMIKERMVTDEDTDETALLANKHDEVLFETDDDDETANREKERIREHLQDVHKFRVPIVWDAGEGKNWKEAKP